MHVGLTPWSLPLAGSADSLACQAERAEALGFESLWLPESHFTGPGSIPAPLVLLAAVASRTRRIRLGTTSFLLPIRHPLHAAQEVAVLDQLSGGRVVLGVGRGFRGALFAAFDVPAAEKRDRFEASLEVMRAAWRGEPVAWLEDGDAAREPVRIAPLPAQEPHPPVWVAAFGPKAVTQAGRLGLPYLASPIETLSRLEENYARHRDVLAEHGHAQEIPVPMLRTVYTSRDPTSLARAHAALARGAAQLARAPVASLRRAAGAAVDDWAVVGEPEAVADALQLYREKLGTTHLIVRGHVPGVEPAELEASVELLAEMAEGLRNV